MRSEENMTGSYIKDAIEALECRVYSLKGVIKGKKILIGEYKTKVSEYDAKAEKCREKIIESLREIRNLKEIIKGLKEI